MDIITKSNKLKTNYLSIEINFKLNKIQGNNKYNELKRRIK